MVRYQNVLKFPASQFTDRAVRQLIFDVEVYVLQEDFAELMKRLKARETLLLRGLLLTRFPKSLIVLALLPDIPTIFIP